MDDDRHQELIGETRAFVRAQVARGSRTFAEILAEAVEFLFEEYEEEADKATVARLAKEELEAAFADHLAVQATWPETTDCDRLDQVFDALNAGGIVALHDFTCCQNCGLAEIRDELQAAADAGADVTGFTFYHAQDTDRATEGDGLYLTYGHVDGSEANGVAIGRVVADTLREAGFEIDWDGTFSKRIAVRLDWQRRVTASAAVPPPEA